MCIYGEYSTFVDILNTKTFINGHCGLIKREEISYIVKVCNEIRK